MNPYAPPKGEIVCCEPRGALDRYIRAAFITLLVGDAIVALCYLL